MKTKRGISPARQAARQITQMIRNERDPYFRFITAIDEAQKIEPRFHVAWGIARAASERKAYRNRRKG